MGRRRAGQAVVGMLVVAALLVVLALVLVGRTHGPAVPVTPRSAPVEQPVVVTPTRSADPGAVPAPPGAAARATPRASRPVHIRIPAIDVDAPITDLGIAADGTIEVPVVPAQAGWLDTSPAPGAQGPAVVVGHVDSTTGPAVFYLLSSLATGDAIVVTLRDGTTVRFTVDGVRSYRQDAFPTGEVYGPVPGPVLRLVTCGGDYVKSDGGYQSNVVVFAS